MRKSSFRIGKAEQFCRLWEEGGREEGMEEREDKMIGIEY